MPNRPTPSDVYDINQKTGALILGKNRLEEYATKYLTHHCKEALETPMPLSVDKILQEEKLTVKEVCLSRNQDIFGCCLLLDGEVEVYDENGNSHMQFFPAGTILIDPKSEAMYGEGAKRNTLIHEALHWEKDKTYFAILAVKNATASEKLYPILCRQSKTFYEPPEGKKTKENEVKWLEWQAHRLAPRVLMPIDMFRKKAHELMESYSYGSVDKDPCCDTLIEDLSDFFIVSRASVKYRLLEVGLQNEISQYPDYDALYSEINQSQQFTQLTPAEAYKMLSTDSVLRDWVSDGRFVFVDGYFVLADKKYVRMQDGFLHLTKTAKKNLQQCVLNIREQKYVSYKNSAKDLIGFAYLYRDMSYTVDSRILTFHPKYQTDLKVEPDEAYQAFSDSLGTDEEERIELTKMIADPQVSLCQCLWYLMERRKWLYPEKFNEKTELHKNYHGKIKNNDYNNMGPAVLMAVCVGLGLPIRLVEKLFRKSGLDPDQLSYKEPFKTYFDIIEHMPGLPIHDFNSACDAKGVENLGTEIKTKKKKVI